MGAVNSISAIPTYYRADGMFLSGRRARALLCGFCALCAGRRTSEGGTRAVQPSPPLEELHPLGVLETPSARFFSMLTSCGEPDGRLPPDCAQSLLTNRTYLPPARYWRGLSNASILAAKRAAKARFLDWFCSLRSTDAADPRPGARLTLGKLELRWLEEMAVLAVPPRAPGRRRGYMSRRALLSAATRRTSNWLPRRMGCEVDQDWLLADPCARRAPAGPAARTAAETAL